MKDEYWSRRLAVALALFSLLIVVSGAAEGKVRLGVHSAAGIAVFVLSAWLVFRQKSAVSLMALLFSAAGGLRLLELQPVGFLQVSHAVFAQGLLAASFLLVLTTSSSWKASHPFEDGGWPSLRQLAWITPIVTLLQIGLGAAFRHKLIGVIPHVSWAFATAICVMMAGTFVLTQQEGGRIMRQLSKWLLSLTGVQILLGVAAYIARVNPEISWSGSATILHITTGSLVMALSCVLSALILRDAKRPMTANVSTSGQNS